MKFFFLLFALFFPLHVLGLEAGEALENPVFEARAMVLGLELRCMVCQGESINDSPAELAKDMRSLVRAKITEGWSDEKILGYLQERYGDVILMKPPIKPQTWVLWLGPWLFLAFGIVLGWVLLRKSNKT